MKRNAKAEKELESLCTNLEDQLKEVLAAAAENPDGPLRSGSKRTQQEFI